MKISWNQSVTLANWSYFLKACFLPIHLNWLFPSRNIYSFDHLLRNGLHIFTFSEKNKVENKSLIEVEHDLTFSVLLNMYDYWVKWLKKMSWPNRHKIFTSFTSVNNFASGKKQKKCSKELKITILEPHYSKVSSYRTKVEKKLNQENIFFFTLAEFTLWII